MSRRFVVPLAGGVLLLGACSSVPKDFVSRVDAHTRILLPQYKQYVENDPQLEPASKSERLKLADNLQRIINEERAR